MKINKAMPTVIYAQEHLCVRTCVLHELIKPAMLFNQLVQEGVAFNFKAHIVIINTGIPSAAAKLTENRRLLLINISELACKYSKH